MITGCLRYSMKGWGTKHAESYAEGPGTAVGDAGRTRGAWGFSFGERGYPGRSEGYGGQEMREREIWKNGGKMMLIESSCIKSRPFLANRVMPHRIESHPIQNLQGECHEIYFWAYRITSVQPTSGRVPSSRIRSNQVLSNPACRESVMTFILRLIDSFQVESFLAMSCQIFSCHVKSYQIQSKLAGRVS